MLSNTCTELLVCGERPQNDFADPILKLEFVTAQLYGLTSTAIGIAKKIAAVACGLKVRKSFLFSVDLWLACWNLVYYQAKV